MQTFRLKTRRTAAKPTAFVSFRHAMVKAWHVRAKEARDP